MGKKGKYNQKNQEQDTKKKNFMITEEHLMDKTHMQATQYLPFLPSDSLYPPFNISEDHVEIIRKILKDLNYLLYLDFKNFWATILYNPSLKNCIHSCIQFFHRRWLNKYISKSTVEQQQIKMDQNFQRVKDTKQFQYTQSLMKIVLLILYRIMHSQQQNEQLTKFYHLKNQIVGKYILDVPRILQIIEIYGQSNEDIVRVIVKQFVNLSPSLYGDFTSEVMEPLVAKMNKSLNLVKKTTDREQFGIQYNYKRTIPGQMSAGEQELTKKINLLMEIISFYQTLHNIYYFFPPAWAQYTRFNIQIHAISQNLFIQIQQAYKVWHTHEQGDTIYALMNKILKDVVEYFVDFFQKCQSMFITKTIKSNFKEAYMKCLDRILEHYGRRQSLGKRAASSKRYMELYKQIVKKFKIDQFTSQLYKQQTENQTYGLNMEYLIDFKIAIDQILAKMHGRPVPIQQYQQEQKTQADKQDHKQNLDQIKPEEHLPRKKSERTQIKNQIQQLDNLEQLISKRNREDDYYQKLYKNYRTKIQIQYDDQYDDLVDYQKRPMFQDNEKQGQSSEDSSGTQFDQQMEKLHLVKSQSNVSRNRGQGTQHRLQQKYDRKNKVKFVPVKQMEAQNIIKRQANKNKNIQKDERKQKATYLPKNQKKNKQELFDQSKGFFRKSDDTPKQYDDEQCYQQCKVKVKDERKQENYAQEDSEEETNKKGSSNRQGGRGGHGNRGGRGGNSNNYNKPKGGNTNKKRYVAKD